MHPLTSIVIPILDELEIAGFTAAVSDLLSRANQAHEIILLNDGSPVTVPGATVLPGAHRGKGRAVRDGILASRGDVVVVLDADLGALLGHLIPFIEKVRGEGVDVVMAERDFDLHARKPIRALLSVGLFFAQRLFVFHSFRFFDTQCGFKAFKGDTARALAGRQRVEGGMYDIEYLYAAVRNRMRIEKVRVGVVHEQRPSRLLVLKCMRTDPLALIGIKWRGLRGWYRLQ